MSNFNEKIAQIELLLAQLKSELVPATKGKKVKATSDNDKPKRAPTDWIVFCGRVRDLLKENEMPITSGVRESTKFCSSMKTQKAYGDWTDEAILEARASWVMPVTPTAATPAASDVEVVKEAPATPKKVVKARAKKA